MVPKKKGKIINFGSLLTFQGGLTVPACEWCGLGFGEGDVWSSRVGRRLMEYVVRI